MRRGDVFGQRQEEVMGGGEVIGGIVFYTRTFFFPSKFKFPICDMR